MTGPEKNSVKRFYCFKWFSKSCWVPEKKSP